MTTARQLHHLCTDSVDEAVAWLKAHGILRGTFAVQ
jgi:hypothetical protein